MTTVLHITPAYKPAYIYGGPTMSVSKLCEALDKTLFKITVLTTTANGAVELDVKANLPLMVDDVEVLYFPRITKDHSHLSPSLLVYLIKEIKRAKLAGSGNLIVHIHSWWNLVAVLSLVVSARFKIPVVLSPRGMLCDYSFNNKHQFIKTIFHHLVSKVLLKNCYLHATTAKEVSDIKLKDTPFRKTFIISNLIRFAERMPLSTGDQQNYSFKLIFLSRIEEKKGLDQLITAISRLTIKWHLTIAGTGNPKYVNYLKLLSETLHIQHSITWSGEVNNIEKFKLLVNHDLLILPSYNENFANVIVESLSVGTPVVLSKEVGLAEYVNEHKLGWITENQPECIAATITIAQSDRGGRERIRREGPPTIKRDFASTELALKYQNMYKHILHDYS